jgi:replicative DNA helicase
MTNPEQIFLGSAFMDSALIDHAVQAGLKADAFTSQDRQAIWRQLLESRTSGKLTDMQSVFLEMGKACPAQELFSCESSVSTSVHGKKALKSIIDLHSLSQLRPMLKDLLSRVDDGMKAEDAKAALEAAGSVLTPSEPTEHTLAQVVDEARLWLKEQTTGKQEEKVVVTGFPYFDDHATPIQMHEYVVLGARTSTGKSSLMNQIAGVNLARGLRVVIFTLETSARAVVLQIASQRAEVNLRLLRHEMPNKQKALDEHVAALKSQPLLVFEKDLTLEAIESRCRLLAASFKPDLVCIDYMGLMRVKAEGAYERMSKLSKAMIPLRKSLGCALLVAAQLNRGNEKEDRKPTRTDFRDAGSVEEDAHRVMAIHRPSKDDAGMEQTLDRSVFQQELYQLKLRDGPLAQARLNFFAGHTKFVER